MSLLPGIAILVVFAIAAALMFTKKMPALLALPAMALLVALISGLAAELPWRAAPGQPSLSHFLFDTVMTEGASRLHLTMMYAIFGAILSQVVMRQGIAQQIVRVCAEYAGDRKLLLAFLMTAAVAINFTTVTGLGAVIMLGSLVLPILVGSGLSSTFAGSLVLFGISIGGVFNPSNLGFFCDLLKIDLDKARTFAAQFGLILALVALVFLVVEGRKEKERFSWAAPADPAPRRVPLLSLLTPLVPLLLILLPFAQWPIVPAFAAGIMFGCLTTEPGRVIPNLTAAILEGLKDISPVLGLFIGIGMTYTAMTDATTKLIMDPFILAIMPRSAVGYVAFFSILAPLTLYRGPLNLFGLGAGFAALMVTSGALPGAAVMAAFISVGQMQSVCDPTNTANVWLAQFLQDSTDKFLRKTIFYVWLYVLVALVYAVGVMGVVA